MSDYPPQVNPIVTDDGFDSNPKWPKVIGIISIVWGSLGLVCSGCGAVNATMGGAMKPPGMETMPTGATPLMFASLAFGFLLSILLIVAGIMTVSRKPVGKVMHLAYGVLAILSAVLGVFAQMELVAAMEQWMRDNADNQQLKAMGGMNMAAMQRVGMVVGTIFALIYPIFCLIWFGLVKRTASMGTNQEVSI